MYYNSLTINIYIACYVYNMMNFINIIYFIMKWHHAVDYIYDCNFCTSVVACS